jgi:1-phosphofructokinase family hexose kinase
MRGINLIALNPAIDERVVLESFAIGQVHEAVDATAFPAGKGVNCGVALSSIMAMQSAAGACRIFAIVGREELPLFERLPLGATRGLWAVDGGTMRHNLTIVDRRDRLVCHIQRPGPRISEGGYADLLALIATHVAPGDFCVLSGRLPDGLSSGHVERLMGLLRSRSCEIVIDSRPELLRQIDLADVTLAKPNVAELAGLFGADLESEQDIADHARLLAERGPRIVVVSMGPQGAVLVQRGEPGYLRAASVAAAGDLDAVGSGDAMVAGLVFALARDEPPDRVLRFGVAGGYANLFAPGPGRLNAEHFNRALNELRVETVSG